MIQYKGRDTNDASKQNKSAADQTKVADRLEQQIRLEIAAFESLCKKVKARGFSRLTPEQKQALAETNLKSISPTEWQDHIGIKEHYDYVSVLPIIYGLFCNIQLILTPFNFLVKLITIENTLHTTLFLLVATIMILFYEWCIPICLLFAAIKMLFILYNHETFTPAPPDVSKNIDFIRQISEFVAASQYMFDKFMFEVVYWHNTE